MGRKRIGWTKEQDDNLLAEISAGTTILRLTIKLKMSDNSIKKRLKEMGFENFIDAHNVMTG